jgi:hypothetical protein
MCAGSCQGDCTCGASVPRGPRGFTGPAGAIPVFSMGSITAIPNGQPPSATITGTPTNPVLNFTVPIGNTGTAGAAGAAGTNGAAGDNAWGRSLIPFPQPAVNGTATIFCSNTSFMEIGLPIWIETGGSYRVTNVTPITVDIQNLGYPLNAAPGVVITSDSFFQPLVVAQGERGQPGLNGSNGSSGAAALIQIVNTIPTTAPTPGQELVMYQNNPVTATTFRAYQWDGVSAWIAGANFAGTPGTAVLSASGDPQVNFPSYPIGTLAFNSANGNLYEKTAADPAPWSLQFNTFPTFDDVATKSGGNLGTVALTANKVVGNIPLDATHVAPGTYTFDLAYSDVSVSLDSDIAIDYTTANYNNSGRWVWQITNVAGVSKAVTYAIGKFLRNNTLTLPVTIAPSSTIHYLCVKDKVSGKITISDAYVTVAI